MSNNATEELEEIKSLTSSFDKLKHCISSQKTRVEDLRRRIGNNEDIDKILHQINATIDYLNDNNTRVFTKYEKTGSMGSTLSDKFCVNDKLLGECEKKLYEMEKLFAQIDKISIIVATCVNNNCNGSCHGRSLSNDSNQSTHSNKSNDSRISQTSNQSDNSINSVNSSNSNTSSKTVKSTDSSGSNGSVCSSSSLGSVSSEIDRKNNGKKYLNKIIMYYNSVISKHITKDIDNKGKTLESLNAQISQRKIGSKNSLHDLVSDAEHLNERITNMEYYIDQCGHFWS